MPEEFVCEECAYTSIEDGKCPFCGSRMIKIDDEFDKDLAETDDKYDPDKVADADIDDDLEEVPSKGKKKISEDE